MKKLLFGGILLTSFISFAQTADEKVVAKDMLENGDTFEKAFPFTNMKIFQDREVMRDILIGLYAQKIILDTPENSRPKMTQGIYSEKDSEIMEGAMNKAHYDFDEKSFAAVMEKVEEDPQGAFKELLLNSGVRKIKPEEMKKLNEVDKEAISKKMQMMTESGPDVGAKPVPVLYKQ